jgi:pimeloyl-ACP methyl ester carboxylesterase
MRLIAYARPGYSGSTRHPGRTVADAARDTASVLDALGAEEFVTVGFSGGGPHALACAALLEGRCMAAATVAGTGPYGAADLDWLAGMAEENIVEFGKALEGESALRDFLDTEMSQFGGVTPEDIIDALGGLVSDVDKRAMTREVAEISARAFRRAVTDGLEGWLDDDLAFTVPWGFDVEDIRVPVSVWQGDQDMMVPLAHGQWLASHVAGAHAHLLGDEGHISINENRLGDILDDLLQMAGR